MVGISNFSQVIPGAASLVELKQQASAGVRKLVDANTRHPEREVNPTELPDGAILVRNVEELLAYEQKVATARAEGKTIPGLFLEADPRVPQSVASILKAIDKLDLVKLKGQSLSEFFEVDRPAGLRDASAPNVGNKIQWATYYTNCALVATVATQIATQVGSVTELGQLLLVAGAVWKGVIAPLNSKALHLWDDSYRHSLGEVLKGLITGELRPEEEAARDPTRVRAIENEVHHLISGNVAKWDPAAVTWAVGKMALPLLAATAVAIELGVVGAVGGAGLLTLVGGSLLAMQAHRWAHMAKPGAIATFLQNIGVVVKKAGPGGHDEHHLGKRVGLMTGEEPLAHIGGYDICTGSFGGNLNVISDKLEIDQKIMALIYRVTEKRFGTPLIPQAWKDHPQLQQIALADAKERPRLKRELRIETYKATIAGKTEKIAAAQKLLEAPGAATEAQTKRAAYDVKYLGGQIPIMQKELALFENPAELRPLVDRINQLRAELTKLEPSKIKALATRVRGLEVATSPQLSKARDDLAAAEAELKKIAPFVDQTPKRLAL